MSLDLVQWKLEYGVILNKNDTNIAKDVHHSMRYSSTCFTTNTNIYDPYLYPPLTIDTIVAGTIKEIDRDSSVSCMDRRNTKK